MRYIFATAVATGALALACQPVLPPPPYPDPVTVRVEGDSILWQYLIDGGEDDWPATVTMNAGPGWTVAACGTDCVAPAADLAAHDEDVAVVMLGVNDGDPIWQGGWTATDEAAWTPVLSSAPCVAVVLPYVGPGASAAHRAAVDEARDWLSSHGTVVDWADWATAPGVLDEDAIHLAYEGTTLAEVLASVGGDVKAIPGLDLDLTDAAYSARHEAIDAAINACEG